MPTYEPILLIELDDLDITGIADRRRAALARAASGADLARQRVPGSGLALCAFAPGCAALGLAGAFDRFGRAGLRRLMPSLAHLAADELAIDLSRLSEINPALSRLVGQLRIRRLIDGARVEVHHCPAWMSSELQRPATEPFAVRMAGHGAR